MSSARVLLLALIVLALHACTLDDFRSPDRRRGTAAVTRLTFAPALGVNLDAMHHEPSGLYWASRGAGSGPAARPGDTVTVMYSGWLPDGRLFDRSPAGAPFRFILGRGMVIDGWEEGLVGMQQGSRRLLVLPPGLAYGAGGQGMIPPNATLVFDVQVLKLGQATSATPGGP